MFGLGWPELIIILVIVVLIFGASRIKGLGRAVGEGIREFKDASSGSSKTKKEEEAILNAAKKLGIETQGKTIDQIMVELEKAK